eukprot:364626-Chlamydomonas_euryale.AAC.3
MGLLIGLFAKSIDPRAVVVCSCIKQSPTAGRQHAALAWAPNPTDALAWVPNPTVVYSVTSQAASHSWCACYADRKGSALQRTGPTKFCNCLEDSVVLPNEALPQPLPRPKCRRHHAPRALATRVF